MFGGLEIKGGDAKKETKPAEAAPAPAGSSAFSFLNATPPPATSAPAPAPASAPSAEPASSFSFLNVAPAAEPAPAPAPAASGFSFLQEATATEPPVKAEKPAVEVPAPAESTGSAFSFMAASSAPGPAAAAEPSPPPEKPSEISTSTSNVASGFSFLTSGPGPAPGPAPPTETSIPEPVAATTTSTSTTSPMKPPASTTISNAFAPAGAATSSTTPSFAPAGAGVSFGGASANAARPKKKKNRAMKVGVGASSSTPPRLGTATGAASSLPAPSELPNPAEGQSSAPPSTNTREDALDAARRAEEFMNQKMQEQSVLEMETAKEAENAKKAAAAGAGQGPPSAATAEAMYDDEMIAAAAAAAVEAQAMNQKGASKGIMGGLFRRASPPTSSSNLSVGAGAVGGSRNGSFSSTSGSRPPKPVGAETAATKPSSGNSLNSDDGKASGHSMPPTAATPAPPASHQPTPPTAASAPSFPPALPPKPVPPRPVAPPKPKTPQDQLNAILQTFRQNVEVSMGKVTQLRQQRSRLLEERNSAMTQERLAAQQRDLTEQQQTAAAEAEDFELADQLGGVLASYEKEQQECARMLEHIDMAVKELDSQRQSVVDGVQMCFRTIQTQLQTFESTEQSKEDKSDDTFSKKFASMTKHFKAEHERLQNDLKHLERDEELVAEERKEVETAISEQSCDFVKSRDEGKEKLSGMEAEIEELRKQLEAKQAIATQLRNEIAGFDDSILQVRVQFSRQLQRVQKKEATIQDHRSEWEAEKLKFQSEKDEHEAEVKAHSEELEAHEKLMASLKEEIAMADTLEKIVQKEVGEVDKTSSNGKEESADSDLLGLQAEVVKCEAAVSEAREVLKVATASLENLETEMGALIAKIPELEATKKAAAAKRDFKAAGKASKEIKDATARVKECQEELTGEAVERKEAAESELKKLDEELKEKRKVALEKEKETGLVTMKVLAERIQHLVQTKKEVCGEDCEPNKMQGVGAFVLEEQIKTLVLEGKACGEKYGGWEQLIADVLPNEQAEAKEAKRNEAGTELASADEAKRESLKGTEEEEAAGSQVSKKEMMVSFKRLTEQLKDIEVKIEAAAEEEDYDLAAELDEKLQGMMAEIEALKLTDAEMEEALRGDSSEELEAPAEPAATTTTAEGSAESVPTEVAAAEGSAESAPTEVAAAEGSADSAPTEEAAAEGSVDSAPTEEAAAEGSPDSIPPDEAAVEQEVEQNKGMETATEDQVQSTKSTESAESAEEQPTSVTPNASGGDEQPAMKEEEGDEKKDVDSSPVEDGFVAVDDGDL